MMVEGGAAEAQESEILDALKEAQTSLTAAQA